MSLDKNNDLDLQNHLQSSVNKPLSEKAIFSSHHVDLHSEFLISDVISMFWKNRLSILLIVSLFAIGSVGYALSKPNIYKATVILAPSNEESKGGLSGIASQYGGLAAMAGINIGDSNDDKITHAKELVKSWFYLDKFINKYDLKSTFMAVKRWDPISDELVYDDTNFDKITKRWKTVDGKSQEPSSFETYEKVLNKISMTEDKETGLLKLSVSHYSPSQSLTIVNNLSNELNEYFRKLDNIQSKRTIGALKQKIKVTQNAEMTQVFYNMIENNEKTLIMTEVREQYLLKTVVPAMLPEQKDSPKRALISILGTLLGFASAILWVFVKTFIRTE